VRHGWPRAHLKGTNLPSLNLVDGAREGLSMISSIDHLIIRAEDLDTAVDQYRELGFTVVSGGRHPHGTHNALISFQDGSYLELIAFWDVEAAAESPARQGLGLTQYALASDDLSGDVEAINGRGLDFAGPHDGARARPDGVQVAWKTAGSGDWSNRPTLPFFIEDVTAREVRVPGGESAIHANGIQGIARITVEVADLPVTVERYAALLDAAPTKAAEDRAEFEVGPHLIELCAGSAGGGLVGAALIGERGFEISTDAASGARLEVVTG